MSSENKSMNPIAAAALNERTRLECRDGNNQKVVSRIIESKVTANDQEKEFFVSIAVSSEKKIYAVFYLKGDSVLNYREKNYTGSTECRIELYNGENSFIINETDHWPVRLIINVS